MYYDMFILLMGLYEPTLGGCSITYIAKCNNCKKLYFRKSPFLADESGRSQLICSTVIMDNLLGMYFEKSESG